MTSRPNILWYCTDQQRFDTIAALGNPHVVSPAIDGLVANGVAFTHAYCQSPICTPSRASFMTGMYPSRVHNCRNGNEAWPGHPPLISKLLADAGYDCGNIGKFHLQSSGRRTEPRLDDGYRYWKFSHAPRDDWPAGHDYAEWVRENGGDLDALRNSPDRVPPELHQTRWATDCAMDFIREERRQPWFLSINIYDPHPPFVPPRAYAEKFDLRSMPGPHFRESDLPAQSRLAEVDFQTIARHPDEFDGRGVQALYYAMIAQIDDQLGRLLGFLDESGSRKDSVVIFSSDHGESLGDHGLLYKGCRFYEGLVRVPLIFSSPGRLVSGDRSHALVELIDLSATIVDLAEAAPPPEMQGRSLLPMLRGEVPTGQHREFVRSEYFDALDSAFLANRTANPQADKPAEDTPVDNVAGAFATMYRDHRHKLVVYHSSGLGELFNLEDDPWEHDNLWDRPEHERLKHDLICKSFDAAILHSIDVGTRRIAPM